MMRSMIFYAQAAMERAMKVQEVILRAMARKITWWQAAEIIGISDRSMRRWREALRRVWLRRAVRPEAGKAVSHTGAAGHRGAGVELVPGALFRFEPATFSREAGGRARDFAQLQLGQESLAGRGAGGARAPAWSASDAPSATALAGHAAAHRRQ